MHGSRPSKIEQADRRGVTVSLEETTDNPVAADKRNFYKVELWTPDDRIERMLFGGRVWTRRARCSPITPGAARRRC